MHVACQSECDNMPYFESFTCMCTQKVASRRGRTGVWQADQPCAAAEGIPLTVILSGLSCLHPPNLRASYPSHICEVVCFKVILHTRAQRRRRIPVFRRCICFCLFLNPSHPRQSVVEPSFWTDSHTRPENCPSSVVTFTFSPSLMKGGTRISKPVSSRASLVPPPLDESPRAPGSA